MRRQVKCIETQRVHVNETGYICNSTRCDGIDDARGIHSNNSRTKILRFICFTSLLFICFIFSLFSFHCLFAICGNHNRFFLLTPTLLFLLLSLALFLSLFIFLFLTHEVITRIQVRCVQIACVFHRVRCVKDFPFV